MSIQTCKEILLHIKNSIKKVDQVRKEKFLMN